MAAALPTAGLPIHKMPPNGDCLFTTLAVGFELKQGIPMMKRRAEEMKISEMGIALRTYFLNRVERALRDDADAGLEIRGELFPLLEILNEAGSREFQLDQYLELMRERPPGNRQWGGFAEATIFAHWRHVQIGFFCHWGDSVSLMCRPVGPPECTARICALWMRTHFDLLILTEVQWQIAQTEVT